MTHYPTIRSLISNLDANTDMNGTVRTTVECYRIYAGHYERKIHSIAHIAGVNLEMTKQKGLLGVTFYLTVKGQTPKLSQFFRHLERLTS